MLISTTGWGGLVWADGEDSSVLLCTSLYSSVLLCTSLYSSVLLCTPLYSSVLLYTPLYSPGKLE